MVPALPPAVTLAAALLLGGADTPGVPVPDSHAVTIGKADATAEPRARPGLSARFAEEVEPGSIHRLLARRARVNRRRPRLPELHRFGPGGQRLPHLARTPAPYEPFGEGARSRATLSDRASRNRAPRLQTARLGRCSTWCTSIPPPAGLPSILT